MQAWANTEVLQAGTRGNSSAGGGGADDYFVSISSNGNFALGCQTYFVAGWNQCAPFPCCALMIRACMPTGGCPHK